MPVPRMAVLLILAFAGFETALPPPARAADGPVNSPAEREVAEWVIRQGGEVTLHDGQRIRDLSPLPAAPFRIHTINCVDIHGSAADLERIGNLADLRRLYVSSRIQFGGRG